MNDNPEQHKLAATLTMDLGDNPGVVKFYTFEEIAEWATKQQQWSSANGRNKNTSAEFTQMFDQQEEPSLKILEVVKDARSGDIEEASAVKDIRHFLDKFRSHESIHGESPMGQHISGFAEGWAIAGAFSACLRYPAQEVIKLTNQNQLGAFAAGYSLMQSTFPQLQGQEAASIRVLLNKLYEQERQRATERQVINTEELTALREATKALNEEATRQKSALNALHQQYDEFMKLKSPAKYWKDRSRNSNILAAFGMVAFLVISYFSLNTVITDFPPMLEKFKSADNTLGAGTIGLLSAPAAIILTLLALLFRAIIGWLKDATSASERHTMIMAYIAFAGDEKNPMDEEHRRHVLDRMFSPTDDSNTIKDNVHPYLDAIRELRKRALGDNDK